MFFIDKNKPFIGNLIFLPKIYSFMKSPFTRSLPKQTPMNKKATRVPISIGTKRRSIPYVTFEKYNLHI